VHVKDKRMKHEETNVVVATEEMSTSGRLLGQSGRRAGEYQEELSMLQAVPYDS
jgi:hypothetical protein